MPKLDLNFKGPYWTGTDDISLTDVVRMQRYVFDRVKKRALSYWNSNKRFRVKNPGLKAYIMRIEMRLNASRNLNRILFFVELGQFMEKVRKVFKEARISGIL